MTSREPLGKTTNEPGRPGNTGAPLDLVAVGVGGSGGRAWAAALAIVALVGLAAWKPWLGQAPPTPGPTAVRPAGPAASGIVTRPLVTPVVSGLPGSNGPGSGTGAESGTRRLGERLMPGPEVGGLDFTSTGLGDGHRAWGVSTAYVSRSTIVSAVRSDLAAVSPVVFWLPVSAEVGSTPRATDAASRGATADLAAINGPASVAVALAVTWPTSVQPVSVELVDRGAPPSINGGSGRGRPAGEVALVNPLPAIVRMTPAGLDGVLALAREPWQLESGTFFLPAADLPATPAGWLTGGWRAGDYEFRVTLPGGTLVRLPFSIGN